MGGGSERKTKGESLKKTKVGGGVKEKQEGAGERKKQKDERE